ncbi:DsbE family thiol:disulfide interchange protein [Aliiroseovarius subalbicans]|uniref:DsbE family thiol:disulfide interchange protein n=1 Tax=Aliiroseovarius subalbicans TaxID=2925840 RepID=UPI001F55D7DC|nr:DsbE family thiol:disulfide interchange protein [Aliiroseovarius subalbicans]MCI2398869.1 DsbE family thiol:disulfide interchange protein [Aliiroseovarius subalbicans]
MAEKKKRVSFLMLLPPLLFAGLAVLFMWGMGRDNPRELESTREGGLTPPVYLTTLGNGAPFGEAELRAPGVKLVNFWASWCAPCRAEHDQLKTLSQEGVTLYGINYKDDAAKGLRFLEELGNPYTALAADPNGRTALDWGLYGVPETYVIDGNGVIVKRFAGPVTESILESVIRPAMAEAAAR